MTAPGWYADPSGDGRMRYWDGSAWTGHVHDPAVGAGTGAGGVDPNGPGAAAGGVDPNAATRIAGDPHGAPPFASGIGPGGPAAGAAGPPASVGFSDLSGWFERLGSILTGHPVPMAVIFGAIPTAAVAAAYVVAHVLIGRGRYLVDEERFDGIGLSALIIIGVAFAVAVVVTLATSVAGSHYASSALARPDQASLGRSLGVGLLRLPRMLAIAITLGLGFYLLLGALFAGLVFLIAESGGGLRIIVILVGIVIGLLAVVATLYVGVRLAHLPVSLAVVPRGVSSIAASWRVTNGRFWPVTLRLVILYGANLVISGMAQGFLSIIAPTLLFSRIEIDDAQGEVFIGGQRIQDLSVVEFSDLLPNPVLMLLTIAVYSAVQGAVNALWFAGTATTYYDVDGPNNLRPLATATAANP